VRELFRPGTSARPPRPGGSAWAVLFAIVDAVLRRIEPWFPRRTRQRAIDAAVAFVEARLNGEDGLGGIYPAMANAAMMFDCLEFPRDHPSVVTATAALRKLLARGTASSYCQPCLSPVWDTGLAALALMEAGGETARGAARRGLDWLIPRQELSLAGDWATARPGVRPGGWAFQYWNAHYPDLDDTAMVAIALDRCDPARYRDAVDRAAEWLVGMRSKSGGWAAFDADNECYYLNYIPFADHGALLDPPTADVSARCVGLLAQLGARGDKQALEAGLAYLRREQEPDGSWFGRWGTNYIYGTWSVLMALAAAGVDRTDPMMRRAAAFLLSKQRPDGGWGEDGASYYPNVPHGDGKASTASQTAWALLGLMAAGEGDSLAVAGGVRYLLETRGAHGLWDEAWYTAVGFPRVFYLRYHGYRAYFPLWALARYRNLRRSNGALPVFGM
jgi:squalene-hopene/tetraprenyl-beta-curcumene cyclase